MNKDEIISNLYHDFSLLGNQKELLKEAVKKG